MRGFVFCGVARRSFWGQSAGLESRLGYVVGLMPPTLFGPRHILQWASKFHCKVAKGSFGGEVYAFSEMIERATLMREFYAPSLGLPPGIVV